MPSWLVIPRSKLNFGELIRIVRIFGILWIFSCCLRKSARDFCGKFSRVLMNSQLCPTWSRWTHASIALWHLPSILRVQFKLRTKPFRTRISVRGLMAWPVHGLNSRPGTCDKPSANPREPSGTTTPARSMACFSGNVGPRGAVSKSRSSAEMPH